LGCEADKIVTACFLAHRDLVGSESLYTYADLWEERIESEHDRRAGYDLTRRKVK